MPLVLKTPAHSSFLAVEQRTDLRLLCRTKADYSGLRRQRKAQHGLELQIAA